MIQAIEKDGMYGCHVKAWIIFQGADALFGRLDFVRRFSMGCNLQFLFFELPVAREEL